MGAGEHSGHEEGNNARVVCWIELRRIGFSEEDWRTSVANLYVDRSIDQVPIAICFNDFASVNVWVTDRFRRIRQECPVIRYFLMILAVAAAAHVHAQDGKAAPYAEMAPIEQ